MLEIVRNRILRRKSIFADVNEGDYPGNEEIHAFGNKMVQKAIEELGKNSVEVSTEFSKSYLCETVTDNINFGVVLHRRLDKEDLPFGDDLMVIAHYDGYSNRFRCNPGGNDRFEKLISPREGFVQTPERPMTRSEVLFFVDKFSRSEVNKVVTNEISENAKSFFLYTDVRVIET